MLKIGVRVCLGTKRTLATNLAAQESLREITGGLSTR